ncbi:MAG: hypothetical protein ACI9U2_003470, partial [Bradymonadia bacterium]
PHRPVRARVAEKMRKGGFSVLIPIPTRLVEPRLIEAIGPNRCRLVGETLFVLRDEALAMREKLQGKMGMTLEAFAAALRDRLQQPR